MFKKFVREIAALAWTLGGTGLVLITLSGQTRQWGIYISVASLILHMMGVMFSKSEDE
jgi:hypothetical protein